MSKAKVLVVDDEATLRKSLQRILEDEGYLADRVASGEACLDQLEDTKYDAVLLDIWLPGMDGIDALKEIRRRYPKQYVIMISGHGTVETAVEAIRLGATCLGVEGQVGGNAKRPPPNPASGHA